ncbi:MAG: aminotransferase class I/II-fold pyridoxal phosphate-dependent enzyme [Elusimicrobiota bacterium]
MAIKLSRRCALITQSEIRAMSLECDRLNGINLAQGVCDTPVPAEVIAGAKRGMDEGVNAYTRYDGIAPLRRAVAGKMKSLYGLSVDAETEIVASAGSTGAFYSACLALLDPGDEVILFEPFYGYHVSTLEAVAVVPRFVRLRAPDWSFDMKDLAAAAGPKTKAIIINTPANPSGKVFTRAELEAVAAFAQERDLVVFTDEIYEHFVYDGRTHLPPAAVPGLRERCVTISGASKTFSVTGWRVGYAVAKPEWARMIGYMSDLIYVCAPAPLQAGVAAGLMELPGSYYEGLRADYAAKRAMVCGALEKAGLPPVSPQGAYYVLADVSRLPGRTGKERAMHLLGRTGVAAVPGEAFFSHPEDGYGLARFCYAKTDEDLKEACLRLGKL